MAFPISAFSILNSIQTFHNFRKSHDDIWFLLSFAHSPIADAVFSVSPLLFHLHTPHSFAITFPLWMSLHCCSRNYPAMLDDWVYEIYTFAFIRSQFQWYAVQNERSYSINNGSAKCIHACVSIIIYFLFCSNLANK